MNANYEFIFRIRPLHHLSSAHAPVHHFIGATSAVYVGKMSTWKNGICGCFGDFSTCIITYFCPCYTFGKNAEAVGDSCILCALTMFCFPIDLFTRTSVRGKIRQKQGIEGGCFGDFLCHLFCGLCALCQEAQEIRGTGPNAMARE